MNVIELYPELYEDLLDYEAELTLASLNFDDNSFGFEDLQEEEG